jgi:hypothetical protein
MRDMTIREFYLQNFPTDELGVEINEKATFVGLITELFGGHDVYDYIGVVDSIIRERCFEELAKQLNKPYDFVYDMWLNS